MLRSRLVRTTVVLALVVIPLSLFTGRGLAVVGPEYRVLFGPIGVGAGQGARVNVYAIGNPNDLPWEFAVRIFNTRGDVVQQREFRVAPGAIGSFEINIGTRTNCRLIAWAAGRCARRLLVSIRNQIRRAGTQRRSRSTASSRDTPAFCSADRTRCRLRASCRRQLA